MKHLFVFALLLSLVLAAKWSKNTKIKLNKLYKMQLKKPKQHRIIGGETADLGRFPYQVGLALEKDCYSIWCGGALIGQTWVLTSAYCTDGAESAMVYIGGTNRAVGEVTYNVSSTAMYQHPEYSLQRLANNIALISIPPVTLSIQIAFVRLPPLTGAELNYTGQYAWASGWGSNNQSLNELSPILQYASLPIISDYDCSKTYGSVVLNNAAIICTSAIGGAATCNGDSGGPLVLKSSSELVGITSFVENAGCTAGKASIFVRVDYYLDWIKNKTGISH